MKNRRNTGSKAATLAILAALTVSVAGGIAGFAAPTNHASAAVSEQAIVKNLSVLENRFFSRQYANDPTEKRLERLELLVFGATQGGSNEERYNHLQSSVMDRARESAKTHVADNKKGSITKDTAAQYPILNTLEWRALKKTYPNESLDTRLARLEKQLFGAENQAMAYVDRVDRLKKTLGVDVVAAKPTGPLGPAPKAHPRGQGDVDGYFGYTAPPMFDDGSGDNPLFSMGMPGFGMGMGMPGMGFGLTGSMNKMFADMNRQMAQMNKLGPGTWVYDQNKGAWIEQNSGRVVKPSDPKQPWSLPDTPGKQGPSTTPKRQTLTPPHTVPQVPQLPMFQQQKKDLDFPPYADPNSI